MAALNSPFKCGGVVQSFPSIPPGMKLTIRIEDLTSATLKIKKNGDPTTYQDYLIYQKEFIEISDRNAIVSVLNAGADPNIYWTFEPILPGRP